MEQYGMEGWAMQKRRIEGEMHGWNTLASECSESQGDC